MGCQESWLQLDSVDLGLVHSFILKKGPTGRHGGCLRALRAQFLKRLSLGALRVTGLWEARYPPSKALKQ